MLQIILYLKKKKEFDILQQEKEPIFIRPQNHFY